MMMKNSLEGTVGFKKYDSYKASGVEWLGDIPEQWECIRIKRLYKDVSIKNRPNELLSSVTQDRGVIPRDWIESRMVMPTGNLETFKFIEKEDFAISLRSFEGGLEYCNHDGIISPAYTVLKKRKENLHPLFYKYLFKSISFISELQTSVVGIREGKNISFPELSYSFLPVPPLPEQTTIAQFLDDKTTKIDQAIAIKQQQIALLKERKQILIHKAVTRGLNENVALKDSGVEWIGEIPEHWEVKKVTHLFNKIGSGTTPTSGDNRYYDGRYNFLQTGDLNDSIVFKTKRTLKERAFRDFSSLKIYPKGSLVMAMYGATIGKLGILGVKSATNQACCIFGKPNNLIIEYFFQVLLAFRTEIISLGYGGGQPNISQDLIKSLRFPIAPLSEQKEIANYIETASTKMETAMSLKEQEISKLQEYKSSLINSVVTGKVKVC